MRTPKEQREWELLCYGCTQDDLRHAVEHSITYRVSGAGMIAMSMLSDAQEQLERNLQEDARQTINRAKWVIRTYLMPAMKE